MYKYLLHFTRLHTKQLLLRGFSSRAMFGPANFEKNVDGGETEKQRVSIQRVITQEDLQKFSQLTGDHNPVHFASQGRSIVHGALLNGLVSGVIGTKLPGPGTIVVSQNLRFPAPCYIGETVTITVEITSARKIIMCKYECTVEGSKIVMDGEAKLVQSKPHNCS